MRERLSRTDAIRMISKAREALCAPETLQDLMSDWRASTVVEALQGAYAGVTNGYLSQVCAAISGRNIEVVGEVELRYPCPCCGLRTLTELYNAKEGTGYDICDHCKWEDDGTTEADAKSSVNRGTIAQYRARLLEDLNYYFQGKWRQ